MDKVINVDTHDFHLNLSKSRSSERVNRSQNIPPHFPKVL